jgi:hypothetical protein
VLGQDCAAAKYLHRARILVANHPSQKKASKWTLWLTIWSRLGDCKSCAVSKRAEGTTRSLPAQIPTCAFPLHTRSTLTQVLCLTTESMLHTSSSIITTSLTANLCIIVIADLRYCTFIATPCRPASQLAPHRKSIPLRRVLSSKGRPPPPKA